MKPQLVIVYLLVLGLSNCKQKDSSLAEVKSTMKLTFEVIPEDFERNLFYVEWEDTLGLAENYRGDRFLQRPKEVWCVITNERKTTLGYYKGLSTAQTLVYFQSKDTIVTLNFMIGLNFFTDKFESSKNMKEYEQMARDYSKDNALPVEFEPVKVNLKAGLRKKYTVELKEK
jgi:hypothetical protein